MEQPLKPIETTIAEWLTIAVERFQSSIKANKIGVTQKLFNSFVTNIFQNSGGSISKVEIAFLFYGRYVDMRVGNGTPLGAKRDFKNTGKKLKGRSSKKWYSKTKAYEVGQLTRLLADQYGLHTAKAIESALDGEKFIIEI